MIGQAYEERVQTYEKRLHKTLRLAGLWVVLERDAPKSGTNINLIHGNRRQIRRKRHE
jgi:hypothetical protein